MKKGRASKTAQWVCICRAMADGGDFGVPFHDPTARAFLPPNLQALVDRFFEAKRNPHLRKLRDRFLQVGASMMLVRTLLLDRAVAQAKHEQVVILGAGYDGRAWRMPELSNSVVFEVDHPDTQTAKRAQIGSMKSTAREVRFVAVDFTRDDLATKLREAGHDPSKPTTWLWEGVVMYLTGEQIRGTLAAVQKLSAKGSALAVLYLRRGLLTPLLRLRTVFVGEPMKSAHTPEQMRDLLREFGFDVAYDKDIPGFAQALSPDLAKRTKRVRHLRTAVANRV